MMRKCEIKWVIFEIKPFQNLLKTLMEIYRNNQKIREKQGEKIPSLIEKISDVLRYEIPFDSKINPFKTGIMYVSELKEIKKKIKSLKRSISKKSFTSKCMKIMKDILNKEYESHTALKYISDCFPESHKTNERE